MRIIVIIDVDDLEKGIAFYRDALGLRLGRTLFDGTVAEMLGAPAPIQLIAKSTDVAAVPHTALARTYDRHWTPVHLDFEVEDVDAAVQRALGAGATLEGAARNFAWGRLATLSDPFGHGFCLLQFTGTGYS